MGTGSAEKAEKQSLGDVKKTMKKLFESVTDAESTENEHRKCHDHYRIRFFWCAFLPIALISGFQTIIAGPSDWCWKPQLLRIVLALLTMLISGNACYWQWDSVAEKHLQSAKRLSSLIAETQHRMCKELTVVETQSILQSWYEKEAAIIADAPKECSCCHWFTQSFPCLCFCGPACCFAPGTQHGKCREETTEDGLTYDDDETAAETAFSKLEKWADDKALAHSSANARFKVMYFWLTFVPVAILSSIQAFLAAAAQDIPFLVRLKLAEGEVANVVGIVLAVAISLISGIAGYWKWDATAKEHEFACKYWIDFKLESQRERGSSSFKEDPGRLLGHLWKKLILNLRDQPMEGGVKGYAETNHFEKWAASVLQPSSKSLTNTAHLVPLESALQPSSEEFTNTAHLDGYAV
mmetsp:Transcript_20577/g.40190  ORF Transcript_20577/g.40190 Transcript_20577/m.40190 type:complete len:410 (-) Transcript_20577:53-1282(-)